MKIIDWITEKLSDNSTWRGIIALITAAGVTFTPEQADHIVAAGIGLIGLINVFRNGKK
jgi:hypothetical protein